MGNREIAVKAYTARGVRYEKHICSMDSKRQEGLNMDNMTALVSCFVRAYHCKNSESPVFADSIGMRFACEYPDEINGKTHVSVITREEWLNKLTENMICWAEDKLGSREYAGWCLSFIEDSLEKSNVIEIFGGDTAKESAFLYADGMRQGIPERGAFAFYDCICQSPDGPVNWGHCGISLGDSRIIHAWDTVRIDDYREIKAMTALSGDHPKYIGWVPVERVLKQKENG